MSFNKYASVLSHGLPRIVMKYYWYLIFFITGLLYFRVASLQIDPHHDGIILAPAVAVSEGLTVQSQAFSQYGPLSPLLQGFWLFLSSPTLLNLRIFTAVQVGVISIVLYKVLKNLGSPSIAKLTTLLWLACSGVWATKFPGALLPWPSLIATLFTLTAYLFYLNSEKFSGLKSSTYLVVSGMLIGLSGFARLQAWLLISPFLLAILLSKEKRVVNFLKLVSGFLIGILMMVGYLYSQGALDDFYRQSILFPLTVYPSLGSDNRYNRFQTGLYAIELLVFVGFLWLIWKSLSRYKIQFVYLISFTLTSSALAWGFWIQRQETLWIRLRILFGEPFERILVSPFYSVAIGSFIVLAYFAFRTRLSPSKIGNLQIIPSLFAAIAAIQLFPQTDVMHLWWITPLCLPFLSQSITVAKRRFGDSADRTIQITFSTFIVIGLFFALNFIRGPWVEYQLPVLKGTYAANEKVERVDFYAEILKYAKPGSASFDCGDGLYSVSGGSYLAADEWYVNWGYLQNTNPLVGQYRFICDRPVDYANLEADRLGMKVINYLEHTSSDYPWSLAILKRG